jgi:hypothetical protein
VRSLPYTSISLVRDRNRTHPITNEAKPRPQFIAFKTREILFSDQIVVCTTMLCSYAIHSYWTKQAKIGRQKSAITFTNHCYSRSLFALETNLCHFRNKGWVPEALTVLCMSLKLAHLDCESGLSLLSSIFFFLVPNLIAA